MKKTDLRVVVISLVVLTCIGIITTEPQYIKTSSDLADLQLTCAGNQLFLSSNRDQEFKKEGCGERFPFLFFSKLNINTANRDQLLAINGLGPKSVEKIINYRKKYGEISSSKDLLNIAGFGPTTISKLSQNIKYQ